MLYIILNKQGSFITGVLSTASAAHSGAIWRTLASLLVVSHGIRIPPYCTYMQSFNFISVAFPEISLDKKSVTK